MIFLALVGRQKFSTSHCCSFRPFVLQFPSSSSASFLDSSASGTKQDIYNTNDQSSFGVARVDYFTEHDPLLSLQRRNEAGGDGYSLEEGEELLKVCRFSSVSEA